MNVFCDFIFIVLFIFNLTQSPSLLPSLPPSLPPSVQVYIDGVGPMSSFPPHLAALGIKLLQSKPLRSYAGTLSYHNPSRFSPRDAMHIGRIHTLRPGWDEASVRYMLR